MQGQAQRNTDRYAATSEIVLLDHPHAVIRNGFCLRHRAPLRSGVLKLLRLSGFVFESVMLMLLLFCCCLSWLLEAIRGDFPLGVVRIPMPGNIHSRVGIGIWEDRKVLE